MSPTWHHVFLWGGAALLLSSLIAMLLGPYLGAGEDDGDES